MNDGLVLLIGGALLVWYLFYWPVTQMKREEKMRERLLTQETVDKALSEIALQIKEAVALEKRGKKVAKPSSDLRIAFYIARDNAKAAGRAVHQQPEDYYRKKPLRRMNSANTLAQYEMTMATALADLG